MDRARLDGWLEKGILGIVLGILVLGPLMFGAARISDFEILQGMTAVAALLWAARLWTRDEHRLLWPPFAWVVAAFLGYALWHYTRADVEYIARLEVNRVITYAALFFIVLDSLNRQEWSQAIVVTLVFLGMVMSMYAVFQFLTVSKTIYNTPQPQEYWGRAGGPYVCPNHLAGYLAVMIPMGLSLAVAGRFKVVTKVLLGYAALVMLAGLYVTLSRGGWLAAAIGLTCFFAVLMFRPGFRLVAIVLLVLLVGGGLWFGTKSFRMQKRLAPALQAQSGLYNDRQIVWRIAKEIWHEEFWLGAGPAHFDTRFRVHRPALQQMQGRPNRVHNDYLNTLTDWGIVGFSIIIGGLAVFWIGALRIWRFVKRSNELGSKQSTRAAIVLGASCGLIALLAHSIVDFNMHIPANAITVVTLMAVVTGHWRFATERFWFNPRIGGRIVATLVALTAVWWLGSQSVRIYKEQRFLALADSAKDPSPERLEWFRKAAEVEPMNPLTAFDVGEQIRRIHWSDSTGYEKHAEEAITWYKKVLALDKHSPYGGLGMGMAMHWIGKPKEAWPWFREMMRLDRHSYYTQAHYGWHLLQFAAYPRALEWFHFSRSLRPKDNPIADAYYEITKRRAESPAVGADLAK